MKLLLTGDPGCGKTTVLRRLVERLRDRIPITGFLTVELREGGRRRGFGGVTIDGGEFLLAHRDTGGDLRVGGRDVFVCCEGCVADLQSNPSKYLPAMDPQLERPPILGPAGETGAAHDHGSHSHDDKHH